MLLWNSLCKMYLSSFLCWPHYLVLFLAIHSIEINASHIMPSPVSPALANFHSLGNYFLFFPFILVAAQVAASSHYLPPAMPYMYCKRILVILRDRLSKNLEFEEYHVHFKCDLNKKTWIPFCALSNCYRKFDNFWKQIYSQVAGVILENCRRHYMYISLDISMFLAKMKSTLFWSEVN